MQRLLLNFSILLIVFCSFLAQGQVPGSNQVALFTFTGAVGNEISFPPDFQPNNAFVSDMSRGPVGNPTSAANVFAGAGWPLASTGINLGAYFEFTITPDPGFALNIDSIGFGQRRSGTGPLVWEVRSSRQNYTAKLFGDSSHNTATGSAVRHAAWSVTGFQQITQAVTFRIYAYEASATTGTFRIDSLFLVGSLNTATPFASIAFAQANRSETEANITFPVNLNITNPQLQNGGMVKILVNNGANVAYGAGQTYTTNPATLQDTIMLNVTAGASSASFDVTLFNNNMVEPNKVIDFTLVSAPQDLQISNQAQFRLTIIEDDTPTTPILPLYTIGQINKTDADGVVDSNGVVCRVRGTVLGINIRTSGYQFTIIDGNEGIGIFSAANLSMPYTVTEGDLIEVRGTVSSFRGLAQVIIDSVGVVSQNAPLPSPVIVTTLGENTESRLIRINNLTLVDPTQWPTSGATGTGRNVDATNGSQTFLLRIVNTSDMWGTPAPSGSFDLVGIGSQFTSSTQPPFVGGYQIFPRRRSDILPIVVAGKTQLALFTFTGSTGDDLSFPPDGQPANAVVSDMSRGTGSTPTAANNVFIANAWPQTGFDPTAYFEFTITPNANFSLNLDTLRFSQRRSNSGPVIWAIRSNIDGFSSNIATDSTFASTTSLRTHTLILSGFTNAISPVTFRIYAFGAIASTGTFRIDNVELWGTANQAGGGTNATIRFNAANATLTESNTTVPISLSISNPLQNPGGIVKLLATNGANVVYGVNQDYTTNPAVINDTISLIINAGASTASFNLNLFDDAIPEPTKTFSFTLVETPANMTIGSPAVHSITLLDNDAPAGPGIPLYTIGQINKTDADGVVDSNGVVCRVRGTVLGINIRTSGYQFTIIDGNEGIGIFSAANLSMPYTVTEGDLIEVRGTVSSFRGLAQVIIDSVGVVSQNAPLPSPLIVTTLGENTESRLIRINNLTLVDPTQWPTSGATGTGRNVDATNGSQTFLLRIVNTSDMWGTPAPSGSFDLVGIGSQFTPSTQPPFVGGYQIFPRRISDIIPIVAPSATQLALFTFTGALGNEPTFAPDAQPTNAVVSDMSRGTGSTPTTANNVFNANAWPQTGFDPTAYFEFTITPNANFSLNLDTLRFSQRRSNSGPITWTIRTSRDAFATNIASDSSFNSTTSLRRETIVLNGFRGTGAVTFRIYAFGATASTGTFRIDNVELWGTVVAGGGGGSGASISFSQASLTVTESNTTLPINLNISNASQHAGGIVRIRAINGANVVYGVNQDYTTNPAVINDTISISVAAGASSASFNLTLYDDLIAEPTKNWSFTVIQAPMNIGNPNTMSITLLDNDAPSTTPLYNIAQVRGINADGVVDSNGVVCRLRGVVVGYNIRTTGYQFTIVDQTAGIGVFRTTALANPYIVTEGDQIEVRGTINTFRGLAQITIDSLSVISSGNALPTPAIVTVLDEFSESRLIRMNNVALVDPTQWPIAGTSGTGRNVDITNGTQNFTLRLLPQTNIWGTPAPTVNFDVIGVGSQFSPSLQAPFVGGYQIFPRNLSDIVLIPTQLNTINKLELSLFPNPASTTVQIKGIEKPTNVQVFTLTGQLVAHQALVTDGILYTANMPNGIYLVRIQSDNGTITKRLVIAH